MDTAKRQWKWAKITTVTVCLFAVWMAVHIPAIFYSTENVPLYKSYVGDEQSPMNGALHILQEKSLLAPRNLETVYYGPVFSLIALPAVVADYGSKLISGEIKTADDYKNFIIWDWGGIIWKLRIIATAASFLGLWGMYRLLLTRTINPEQNKLLAWVGTLFLAANFYYFDNASFFRHWAFVVPLLLVQWYLMIRIVENGEKKIFWLWQAIFSLASFGISYVGILFQLMWLPVLAGWWGEKNSQQLKRFGAYVGSVLGGMAFIVWWQPHSFFRVIGLTGGDIIHTSAPYLSTEVPLAGNSFVYYAQIIFQNHLAILLFALVAGAYLVMREKIHRQYWLLAPLIVGAVHYLVFGLMSHHENRYALPATVSLIVFSAMLFVRYFSLPVKPRVLTLTLCFLLGFYFISSVFYIAKWTASISQGTPETAIIAELQKFQKENPNARTLLVGYDLLGAVHTKEAYKNYMENFGRSGVMLYEEMLKTPYPKGAIPLNVYYADFGQHSVSGVEKNNNFDRVIYISQQDAERMSIFHPLSMDLTWWRLF